MGMRTIAIAEATEEQLRQFCQDSLGLSVHPSAKRETIISRIRGAQHQGDSIEILVDDIEPATGAAPPQGEVKPDVTLEAPEVAAEEQTELQRLGAPEKVMVNISMTDEPGGKDPVPVGVNGRVMLIPRNKNVEIPFPYFEALNKAVTYVYDPGPDGLGLEPIPRKVKVYPVSLVSQVPQAVLDRIAA